MPLVLSYLRVINGHCSFIVPSNTLTHQARQAGDARHCLATHEFPLRNPKERVYSEPYSPPRKDVQVH